MRWWPCRPSPVPLPSARGLTVLLASRLGLPVSTTHALVGGLVGAGYLASPIGLNLKRLGGVVLLPLIAGPMLAMLSTWLLYPLVHRLRQRLGIGRQACVCIGAEVVERLPEGAMARWPSIARCPPSMWARSLMDGPATPARCWASTLPALWIASTISAAGRGALPWGLNGTARRRPQHCCWWARAGGLSLGIIAVAIVMAIGGLLGARRVAETMAHRVTAMNPRLGGEPGHCHPGDQCPPLGVVGVHHPPPRGLAVRHRHQHGECPLAHDLGHRAGLADHLAHNGAIPRGRLLPPAGPGQCLNATLKVRETHAADGV